jgi:UDP:flavonoid glycosyltransferase YjiC (YdhE family)
MRILVVAAPGVGHLLPLLPLARAAAARGHEVRIAAGSSLRGIAEAADIPFDAVGPATIDEVRRTIPGIFDVTGRRRALLMFRGGFCGTIATEMADDLRRLAERWRPDLIVREDMAFGAWVAADAEGIRQLTVQTTAWRPRMRDLGSAPLNELRARHGLPSDPELASLPGLAFFMTRPPSLRAPDEGDPDVSQELRPVPDDRHGGPAGEAGEGVAAHDPFPPREGWPRVAVTLGTVNAYETAILRTIVDGAAATGADVVVALGADPATLGGVPDGVAVRAYVPMSDLLPAADLVVFHAGSGTMLAALAAGVPMVMVPLAADQPDNADRCAAAGVAAVVPLEGLTPAAIRDAIRVVAADPSYRRRAEAVAAEIAAMPGPDAAIETIERLVAAAPG